jgi:hypothetical protein
VTAARVECLSVPKWRDAARGGDDVVVALPDRLFAVFDGATDTSGTFNAPISPGRFAATTAAQAMVSIALGAEHLDGDGAAWLRTMNGAIKDGLVRLGAAQARVSSTAAVALPVGEQLHLLTVGDSGIRINGQQLMHTTKDVDRLFTQVRLAVRAHLQQQQGLLGDELEATTRQLVFKGLAQEHDMAPDAAQVDALIARVTQACTPLLQADAIATIAHMVRAGIAGGQYGYANRLGHSLGYASLDGGSTAGPDVCHRVLPRGQVHSLELFTDGYACAPASGITVADWERQFAQTEAEDPAKVGRYAGVKGSTSTYWSDDRSVLVVTFS